MLLVPMLLLGSAARGEATLGGKLAVEKKGRLSAWLADVTRRALTRKGPFMECREIVELPRAFVCVSDSPATMNAALTRASMFATDRVTAGHLSYSDDKTVAARSKTYGGHDLSRERLERFYKKADETCALYARNGKASTSCVSPEERDFREGIYEVLRAEPFALAAVAVRSKLPPQTALSHEVKHAQLARDARYRAACEEYWKSTLTEVERVQVRKTLASENYDPKDDALMADEFQAFLLMDEAEKYNLDMLVAKHRAALLQALKTAGARPLRLEF